ncbi:MAG: hypothetical protein KIB43_08045 [Clostridium baratii]|uniref:hypothetical protein n=1 Tax=Clostridium baratii TaxID=1561 RepID=UPI00243219F2|nr:hypothetical protein [Clostridium baratii]MBS6006900.1 hypothetical protein [Clostridium baratii]MDU1053424.1 hypothetical protein [Clostridium baratii]
MKYDFKAAYDYALNTNVEDLAKRCTVYNAYIGQVYDNDGRGPVGHDVVLSMIGSIYGPFGNLDEEAISEIGNYLKYIDRGFDNHWGTKTYEWFSNKLRTREDNVYLSNLANVLMSKSDSVYNLLCENSYIPTVKLIGYAFEQFDDNSYRNWRYI